MIPGTRTKESETTTTAGTPLRSTAMFGVTLLTVRDGIGVMSPLVVVGIFERTAEINLQINLIKFLVSIFAEF